ncbi:MAG: universal stress protein, partial [Xanthobacteraceae bacterium]
MMDIVADIGAEFRASAKHAKDVEWRGRAEQVNDMVSNAARAADLVIIGQESKLDDELHYKLDPGIVILSAGRPVLVVPDDVDSLAAQRIVLAWKDTRESRRAVRDALPFLKEAKGVMLAEISERRTESQSRSHLDDTANYLLRHG